MRTEKDTRWKWKYIIKKISNIDADDDKEENEQKIKNNEEGSSTKVADSKGGEDGSLVSSN